MPILLRKGVVKPSGLPSGSDSCTHANTAEYERVLTRSDHRILLTHHEGVDAIKVFHAVVLNFNTARRA